MITVRKSKDRGRAEHGWLSSRHTFSFGDYYDAAHMGFSVLRVINEDRIKGGTGFDPHGHRDMEIVSFVLEGALEHEDSMGNKTVIRPGEIQRMSAGTGVRHSENNHFKDQLTHFLQIWILPSREGIPPSYEQMNFEKKLEGSNLILLASRDGKDGSIHLHQDVAIHFGKSVGVSSLEVPLSSSRCGWLQMISGEVELNGVRLMQGDGCAIREESILKLKQLDAEFLLFDLPEDQK